MRRWLGLAPAFALAIACGTSSNGGAGADAGVDASTGAEAGAETAAGADAGGATDTGTTAESGAAEAGGCGEFAGDTQPTCSGDGNSLGDCVGGVPNVQACPYGCLHGQGSAPASCLLASATNFSCTGSYGTVPVNDGNYYLTEFGCYVDDAGVHDRSRTTTASPRASRRPSPPGLCPPGSTGPQCEETVDWYTADGARFGCLARLRVTNPANGKSLVAVALDFGPGCSGENEVDHAVLDASGPVDDFLFGGPEGSSDEALVHVVQVADATPLGPQ